MKDNDRTLDLLLKEMAASHQPQLPSPGLIWWRAQLYKKQNEKERIERPVIVMQQVAAIVSATICVVVFADNFSQMQTVLRNDARFLVPLLLLPAATALVSALPFWSRVKR
jgi:hypothetical protein